MAYHIVQFLGATADPYPATTNRKVEVIAKKAKDSVPPLVEKLLEKA